MAGSAKAVQPLYSHWGTLTPKEFSEIVLDFEKYCEQAKIIINKELKANPFKLNEAQLLMAWDILPEVFHPTPSPTVVVFHKSRQIGASVFLAALEQYIATRKENISIYHLLPTDDLANKFYEQKARPLLEGTHPSVLPEVFPTTKPNVFLKFKKFGDKTLNSYIRYGGALSKGAGRSGTNHIVVFDEYAFYERVTQLERGILATQPKTGMVLTVYVSTANGTNHFYDVCKHAKKEGSRIKYRFLPWHLMAEYEAEPEDRLKELTELTEYELKLCQLFEEAKYPVHRWSAKMQWYDNTLKQEAKGDKAYMMQEYPSTSEESFEATGDPVLPASILLEWRKEAEDVPFDYIEQYVDGIANDRNSIAWRDAPVGTIKRFKEPKGYGRYMIGIDPSSGYSTSDYQAGVVLDTETMEEVCSFKEKMEQTELADLLVSLAKHYDNAIIVPERNMGSTLIDWIRLQNYHRLYFDPMSTKNKTLFGIHMTRPVKDEAITRMKYLMNNGLYKTKDVDFIDDALHFIYKTTPGGMKKAMAAGTDDNNKPYGDDTVLARLVLMSVIDFRRFSGYAENKNHR